MQGSISIAVSAVNAGGSSIEVINSPLDVEVEGPLHPAIPPVFIFQTSQPLSNQIFADPLATTQFYFSQASGSNALGAAFIPTTTGEGYFTYQGTEYNPGFFDPGDPLIWDGTPILVRYVATSAAGSPHRITFVSSDGYPVKTSYPTYPSDQPFPYTVLSVGIATVDKLTSTSVRVTTSGPIDVLNFPVTWLKDIDQPLGFLSFKQTSALVQKVSSTVSDWTVPSGSFLVGQRVGPYLQMVTGLDSHQVIVGGGLVPPTASPATVPKSSIFTFLALLKGH